MSLSHIPKHRSQHPTTRHCQALFTKRNSSAESHPPSSLIPTTPNPTLSSRPPEPQPPKNTPPHGRHASRSLRGPFCGSGQPLLRAPGYLGPPVHPASPALSPSPSSSSFTSLAAFSPSSRKLRSIILLRSTAALSSALNVQPMAAAGEGTEPGLTHTPQRPQLGWLRQRLRLGGGPLRQLPGRPEKPDIRLLRHFRPRPAAVTAQTCPARVEEERRKAEVPGEGR